MILKIEFYSIRPVKCMETKEIKLEGEKNILEFSHIVANAIKGIKQSCNIYVYLDEKKILELVATVKKNGILFVSNYWDDPNCFSYDVDIPEKYLQMVNADYNNNKYYRLFSNDNPKTFVAEYGRNGVSSAGAFGKRETVYPLYMYYIKFLEKLSKGYKDNSKYLDASAKVVAGSNKKCKKYKEITDQVIKEMINYLQAVSAQVIEDNYQIEPILVSKPMLDEAKSILDELRNINDLDQFNKKLVDLFTVLPRKMARVKDNLADDQNSFSEIILNETDLLDTMITQVMINQNDENELSNTILDALGISIELGDDEDLKIVKENLNNDLDKKVVRVYRVKCKQTYDRYHKYLKNNNNPETKLLWHGSRNENWLSILSTGLSLNPNAQITGKMFGYGIYFAPKASKSWGYTSARGAYWTNGSSNKCFMALFETAYGNPLIVDSWGSYSGYTSEIFKQNHPDCNCLHAKATQGMLLNDEIIFFDESQINIKYLVEFES